MRAFWAARFGLRVIGSLCERFELRVLGFAFLASRWWLAALTLWEDSRAPTSLCSPTSNTPQSADGWDSRAPTSLRSPTSNTPQSADGILREGDFLSRLRLERLFLRNPHSLPRMGFEGTDLATLAHLEYPTVCRRHPVQIFLLSISLEQAQIRLFVKIFAERGGFEPPKPFWSLHALQACLFNHSSISPLKSNPRGSIYFLFGP